jgi:hypothetical protein
MNPHKAKTPYVVIFSDVHIGAVEHTPELLAENVEWCREHNATVILNGDIVENAILAGDDAAGDKLLGQAFSPTDQLKKALEVFAPIKSQIIASTRGNHEARTRRKSLLDISELISFILEVPYLGIGGMIPIEYRGRVWIFTVHHGKSGGSNPWGECEKLLGVYPQSDLIALGHNHHLSTTTKGFLHLDQSGKEVRGERVFLRTGSYLGFADYVREMGLSPERQGSPLIILPDNPKGRLEVDLFTLSEDAPVL